MKLDRYLEQHTEIHRQLATLKDQLQGAGSRFDPGAARQGLVTLGAKLNIHLAFEDQALYPPLLNHQDQLVRSKVREYMAEVGGLKGALAGHLKAWLSTRQVEAEPEKFRSETRTFLEALERRLRAEDQEFYPLLERLA
jgi:hemerythrin-like domain-containing protein